MDLANSFCHSYFHSCEWLPAPHPLHQNTLSPFFIGKDHCKENANSQATCRPLHFPSTSLGGGRQGSILGLS